MYIIITDENEIKEYQDIFEKILQHGIEKPEEKRKIGTKDDQIECFVYWSSELKFWSASSIKKTEKGNRYGNYIGFREPPENSGFMEDVNISFSGTGRTSSKFVKNENKTYFAHNGGVGQHRSTDGKARFMELYKERDNGKIIDVDNEKLVIISELSSDEKKYTDSQKKIIAFSRKIYEIKEKLNREKKAEKEQEMTEPAIIAKNTDDKKIDRNNGNKHNDKAQEPSKNKSTSEKSKRSKDNNQFEKQPTNKPSRTILIKKLPESSYDIAQHAEDYYNQISELRITFNKDHIFESVPEILKIWNGIRTPCSSKDDFGKFIRSLYKLIIETTKDEDPNKRDSNGRPIPIYRLPKEFTKVNTPTKNFMDTVDILRHTIGDAHTQSKLKTPNWKKSYSDVLEELLSSKRLPESREDFQKLQIKVLKQFETSMKRLLEIVKNELNPDKTH